MPYETDNERRRTNEVVPANREGEDEIGEYVGEMPPIGLEDTDPDYDEEKDVCKDYWWRESDPAQLSAFLDAKVKEYQDYVRISTYFAWCRKSWLFYYKMAFQDEGEYFNVGVQALGDEGELIAAQLNHLRNFIQHRLNMVTKDRPALICRARNSDQQSQIQTEFGQGLIEYYMKEMNVENHLTLAVEHSLIFAEGFLTATWDHDIGPVRDADEENLTFTYEGDLKFETPIIWNVIRDLGVRDWNKHDWVGVRRPGNKWSLCARYPEHARAIQAAERWTDVPLDEGSRPFDEDRYFIDTDQVEVLEWWHRSCPAIPQGRRILVCGGAILQDLPFEYPRIPVYRVTPGEMALTPFGYSPVFDLVTIQELINNAVSTIATNQNAHGVQSLWKKSGSTLRVSEVLTGMQLVESDEKPEPLQLTKSPPEIFQFLNDLIRHGELIAGVDQVTRGYTDQNIRSGAHAALLQSQSVQFSSGLMRSYHQLLEAVGTAIITLLKQFAGEERVVTIVGKHNISYTQAYTAEDLQSIQRVTVESTNPMFNSYAGKLEWANMVASTGLVKTPEEILNVFRTGNADTMLEADKAQLNAIREENEALLDRQEIPDALLEDHHVLHMREHGSIMGSLENRSDQELRSYYLAHMMSHMEKLMGGDPNAQMLQTILGYETPIPPGATSDGSGLPTGAPLGNAPQVGSEQLMQAPAPMQPELDGRSNAQIPDPSQP